MSLSALTRHQNQGMCLQRRLQVQHLNCAPSSPMASGNETNDSGPTHSDDDAPLPCLPPRPPRKPAASRIQVQGIPAHDVDAVARQIGAMMDESEFEDSDDDSVEGKYEHFTSAFQAYQEASESGEDSDPHSAISEQDDTDTEEPHSETGANAAGNMEPDTTMLQHFGDYTVYARGNFLPLSKVEERTIRVMHLLKEKKAPMNAYESIMLWHLRESNMIRDHETLHDCSAYIGRKTLGSSKAQKGTKSQQGRTLARQAFLPPAEALGLEAGVARP